MVVKHFKAEEKQRDKTAEKFIKNSPNSKEYFIDPITRKKVYYSNVLKIARKENEISYEAVEAIEYTTEGIQALNVQDKKLTTLSGYIPGIGDVAGIMSEATRIINAQSGTLNAKEKLEITLNVAKTVLISKAPSVVGTVTGATDTKYDLLTYEPEESYGVNYKAGPNVKGDNGGVNHFLIKSGDVGILYNAYKNGKYIGQYQTYIRDGKLEVLWTYEQ